MDLNFPMQTAINMEMDEVNAETGRIRIFDIKGRSWPMLVSSEQFLFATVGGKTCMMSVRFYISFLFSSLSTSYQDFAAAARNAGSVLWPDLESGICAAHVCGRWFETHNRFNIQVF